MQTTPSPLDSASWDVLFTQLADGSLGPNELQVLNHAMAQSPDLRTKYLDFCLQSLVLREALPGELEAELPLKPTLAAIRSRRLWPIVFVSGMVVALMLVVLFVPRVEPFHPARLAHDPPAHPHLARVEAIEGIASLESPDQTATPILSGTKIRPGDTIKTVGMASSVSVRLPGGSRVNLGQETAATYRFDGRVSVELHHGDLAADIDAELERPMQVTTPEAAVETSDSNINMGRRPNHTELAVFEGAVKFTRKSDDRSIPVQRGQIAVVADRAQFESQPMPLAPDTLAQEFREGLPAQWELGRLLPNGFPPAVQTQPRAGCPRGTHHQVRSENAWTRGLFVIQDDTWLSVTFRVEKPGFFHFLLACRPVDRMNVRGVVLETPHCWNQFAPGEWHTVHFH
jgi:hypothetical protein